MRASAGRTSEPGGNRACPSAEVVALLTQWNTLQSGFRRLTDLVLADVESKAGVDPSAFQVLWFLLNAPGRAARMQELAQILNFSTAGTTKVADRLADAGLIERSPSRTDRRVIYALLTEQGLDVAATAALALADALRERVTNTLSTGQFEALASAIGSLHPEPPAVPPIRQNRPEPASFARK
jgi:DNA-binding MarR family transcriptional regulator